MYIFSYEMIDKRENSFNELEVCGMSLKEIIDIIKK